MSGSSSPVGPDRTCIRQSLPPRSTRGGLWEERFGCRPSHHRKTTEGAGGGCRGSPELLRPPDLRSHPIPDRSDVEGGRRDSPETGSADHRTGSGPPAEFNLRRTGPHGFRGRVGPYCPPDTYDRQEKLLHRILQMVVSGRVLVLHLRGDSHTDPSGVRPSKIVRAAIRRHCTRHQRIHVHCCLLGTEEVAAWRKAFPHAYFGYTAITARLGVDQRKALAGIPLDRLLIETDSPHLSPDRWVPIHSPAYIGEVAALVARVRQEWLQTILRATGENALRLYGPR